MNERKTCLQALDSLIKELNIFICIDYSTHFFAVVNLYVAIPNLYFSVYLYLYSPKSIFAYSSSTSRNVDTKFSYVWVFLRVTAEKKILIFIILISRQCKLFLRTAAGIPECT